MEVADDAFANSPVMSVAAPLGWLMAHQDLVQKILL